MMSLGLAIIGYGGMGGWHAENVQLRVKEFNVIGIYDVRKEANHKAKENGLHVYASLQELLEDIKVDVVTIAVPNNFHKEYAIACLKMNKHVICEKPVTMNAMELEEIMDVAKACKRVFTIHQNRRWDKDYKIVKEIIKQDLIGKVYYIESRVQGSGRMLHGWRGHKVNGGGMVYDWGVHLFDQILDLVKEPVVSITPKLVNLYNQEVDDNFKVILTFESGLWVLVEVATNCLCTQPRWHICGKEGTAVIEDWSCNGEIVTLKNSAEVTWTEEIVYTAAGPTRTMAPRSDESKEKLALPNIETDWSDYYHNIAGVINDTEELIVQPEQALRVMKLIDIIFEAGEKQESVTCRI